MQPSDCGTKAQPPHTPWDRAPIKKHLNGRDALQEILLVPGTKGNTNKARSNSVTASQFRDILSRNDSNANESISPTRTLAEFAGAESTEGLPPVHTVVELSCHCSSTLSPWAVNGTMTILASRACLRPLRSAGHHLAQFLSGDTS